MNISALLVWWLLLSDISTLPGTQLPGLDHWRFLNRDGTITALDLTRQSPITAPEDFVAFWYWSDLVPPKRFLADELGTAKKLRISPKPAGLRTCRRVEKAKASDPNASGLPGILIAGPQELWNEVPESMMPRWWWGSQLSRRGIPASGNWQVRLLESRRGTYWQNLPEDSPAACELTPVAAPDMSIEITSSTGENIEAASLRVWKPGSVFGLRPIALLRGEGGRLLLQRLPDTEEGQYFFGATAHLEMSLRSLPSALPPQIVLQKGASLRGQLIAQGGSPAAGLELITQAWLEDGSNGYRIQKSTSNEEGYFLFQTLPPGPLLLRTAASPLGGFSRELILPAEGLDLGRIELLPAISVPVRTVDHEGLPIENARVHHEKNVFKTDSEGLTLVTGILPEQKIRVTAEADFYLPGEGRFDPPHEHVREIRLTPAYLLRARFAGPDGGDVVRGRYAIDCRNSSTSGSLPPDGKLEVLVPTNKNCSLRLFSAETTSLEIQLEPGKHREDRDLGVLLADPGRRAIGRLVSATDGTPVAGARLWLPRPIHGQESLAMLNQDFSETFSQADGSFALDAIAAGGRLRIDATGYARLEMDLPAQSATADSALLDLGIIELKAGATVWVLTRGLANGAMARLDRRGEWQAVDQLQASVFQEEALFPRVAAGSFLLTVLDRGKLRCEKQVTIPEEGIVEIECPAEPIDVRGVVLLGGRPAKNGQLMFRTPSDATSPGIIQHHQAPAGQRRSQIQGGGRPQVDVPVADDGTFQTRDLVAGTWEVAWQRSGSVGSPIRIEIPDSPEFVTELAFPMSRLGGQVVDREGKAVPGALVRAMPQNLLARTDAQGTFLIEGASAGPTAVQAELDGVRSNYAEVTIPEDGDAPEVRLILGAEAEKNDLRVAVRIDGRPASGAWALLETDNGRKELASTDSQGIATLELSPPLPARIRLAAAAGDRLVFGPWIDLQSAREDDPILEPPIPGRLLLPAAPRELPALFDAEGWDVAWWLGRLGRRPMTDENTPVAIEGLPPGQYRLRLQGNDRTITVESGETTEIPEP